MVVTLSVNCLAKNLSVFLQLDTDIHQKPITNKLPNHNQKSYDNDENYWDEKTFFIHPFQQ